VLTRFAAQNLYAPLRTVEPLPGVMRVNLRRDLDLGTLMPTLPVRAVALASWRLEDQWVTAVRLTNTGGDWITSTRACCKAISSPPPSSTRRWAARHARGHDRPVPGDARARPRAVAAAGDPPLRPRRASAAAGSRSHERKEARHAQ
jgi:hypothetical protein